MRFRDIGWGPVFVTAGPHKGRIGELDDEDSGFGIVYFGTILRHYMNADIPLRWLRPVTTDDLMNRSEEISRMITLGAPAVDIDVELDALYEYHYISNALQERWLTAQESRTGDYGVFLSHSSIDRQTVRWIAVDLGTVDIALGSMSGRSLLESQYRNAFPMALRDAEQWWLLCRRMQSHRTG